MIVALAATAFLVVSLYFGYVMSITAALAIWLVMLAYVDSRDRFDCDLCYTISTAVSRWLRKRNLLDRAYRMWLFTTATVVSVLVMQIIFPFAYRLSVGDSLFQHSEKPAQRYFMVADVRIDYYGKVVYECGLADFNLWAWETVGCDEELEIERRTITIPNGEATLLGFNNLNKQSDTLAYTQHIKGTAEIQPVGRAIISVKYEGAANNLVLDIGKIL